MLKLLTILLPCILLACSLFSQPDSDDAGLPDDVGPPRSTGAAIPSTANSAPIPYDGPTSIEERILSSTAVARARLTSITTQVVTTTADKWDEDFYVGVKFHLSVSEYLYGSGANSIIAYWVSTGRFNTLKEAEAWAPDFISLRDAQWDDREAVLFLGDESNSELFGALAQPQDVYLLGVGGPIRGDTSHFLDDKYDRRWLPAASATTATPANSQEFLLEQPVAGSTPSTITLGTLKTKIATIVAEIDAGDGSEAYKKCLKGKYTLMRHDEWNRRNNRNTGSYEPQWDGTFASGQPAGAQVYNYRNRGSAIVVDGAEEKSRLWIDGKAGGLFSVEEINRRPFKDNWTLFDFSVVSNRPIPVGTYEFKHNYGSHINCGNTMSFLLTANVTAPNDVRHELFFDPVTVGTTVAADSSNGQLEPAGFTDSNGGSATFGSISYESGTVEIEVTPYDALSGHVVDFIELDGEVSLSLKVDDATVDTASGTLSWSMAEQPWHDGDLLMVRIKETEPEIALIDVPDTLAQGQVASFTVQASGLSFADSYTVRLSLDNEAVGFGSGCGTVSRTLHVHLGNTSFSTTESLYGCVVSTDTVTATLELGGVTLATATAELEVEASSNVTVSLSQRQEQNVTYTDLSVSWNDPSECAGNYFVALYRSNRTTVIINLGLHPAPETTMLSAETNILWDSIPNEDRWVKVSCIPSTGNWTEIGEVPLQSGLPAA